MGLVQARLAAQLVAVLVLQGPLLEPPVLRLARLVRLLGQRELVLQVLQRLGQQGRRLGPPRLALQRPELRRLAVSFPGWAQQWLGWVPPAPSLR